LGYWTNWCYWCYWFYRNYRSYWSNRSTGETGATGATGSTVLTLNRKYCSTGPTEQLRTGSTGSNGVLVQQEILVLLVATVHW